MTIGQAVWQIEPERFAELWNSAPTLDEAALAIRTSAGGPAPRWALLARAAELRKAGVVLKVQHSSTPASPSAKG